MPDTEHARSTAGRLTPARSRRSGRRRRRTAAGVALAAAVWVTVLSLRAALDDFPRGLILLTCGALVAAGVWEGVLRRGWGRVAGLAVAGAALTSGGFLLVDDGYRRTLILLALGAAVWYAAARAAFRPDVVLPAADRPRRPVVVINPRSGNGRAARTGLAAAARDRGIDVLELRPGEDLTALVRSAVDAGADAIGMAGGDGSQAVVAAAAAEAGLPYACIPAGTRNHFAVDLGVDRSDVVGALDALVDGGERVVDLAEINGRIFVNNVSLGVYAEAVQTDGYRAAKVRTLLGTVPRSLGSQGVTQDLSWRTPGGRNMRGAAVILVGNNQYRLGGAAGAGTRPAVDQGLLGVTVLDPDRRARPRRRPLRQWETPEFRVDATLPVPVGIDGEADVLEAPLVFAVRPAALRVRIAVHHPGASPSAIEPVGALAALRALARIARGRDPRQLPPAATRSAARAHS
jgi:diacylglycerol kinase family enzyme